MDQTRLDNQTNFEPPSLESEVESDSTPAQPRQQLESDPRDPCQLPIPTHSDSETAQAEDEANESVEPPDRVLRWLAAVFLVVLTVQYLLKVVEEPNPLHWQPADGRAVFQVEVNSATWIEWMQLRGIGPALAHRIVADRSHQGPFLRIEDLQRVDGIGPATLDQIRPWLVLDLPQPNGGSKNRQPIESLTTADDRQ